MCVRLLNTAYDPDDVPAAPDAARGNGHQDTCESFGCPGADAAYEHLVAKGVAVNPSKVAWYGLKQLHLPNPEGLEFVSSGKREGEGVRISVSRVSGRCAAIAS